MNPDLSRRTFVKMFGFGTAAAVTGAAPLLIELNAAPGDEVGVFKVKLSDFPTLLEGPASIRLSPNPIAADNFPQGYWYPFMINRDESGTFYALNSECRHASCVVSTWAAPFGPATCPCHGSEYGIDGEVLNGPATDALRRYEITYDGADTLTVRVPGLGFRIDGRPVQTGTGSRFRISFPTISDVNYKVRYKATVDAAGTPVSFSLTQDGPATQATYAGNDMNATIYVPITSVVGFYTVEIELLDVT